MSVFKQKFLQFCVLLILGLFFLLRAAHCFYYHVPTYTHFDDAHLHPDYKNYDMIAVGVLMVGMGLYGFWKKWADD